MSIASLGRPMTIDDLPSVGPWPRNELIDGSPYVTPIPGLPHQGVVEQFQYALHAAAPAGSRVLPGANVVESSSLLVIPDVVVIRVYSESVLLKNFLYLNSTALAGYVSSVEDGLRREVETEVTTSQERGVEGDAKVVKARHGSSRGGVDRSRADDTAEARFNRLLELAESAGESMAWIDVRSPETDLADVGFGAMVAGEAEFYVPTMIRTLAGGGQGGISEMLAMVDQFEPLAEALDLDMEDIPAKHEREAMRGLLGAIKASVVVVGEFANSEWKVAGQLDPEHIRAEVEGPARFVGNVAKSWPAGEGRHLLALPGTTLLPRKQRRELERKRPDNPEDDSFLTGPAVMLDLLAVWR